MSRFSRFIYGKNLPTAVIKPKAHALTLIAVVWSPFSVIVVLPFREGRAGKDEIGIYVAIGVWVLHVGLVLAAARLWVRERKKVVPIIKTEVDLGL